MAGTGERDQKETADGCDEVRSQRLFELLGEVKLLAREYYELTEGRDLGVTGRSLNTRPPACSA